MFYNITSFSNKKLFMNLYLCVTKDGASIKHSRMNLEIMINCCKCILWCFVNDYQLFHMCLMAEVSLRHRKMVSRLQRSSQVNYIEKTCINLVFPKVQISIFVQRSLMPLRLCQYKRYMNKICTISLTVNVSGDHSVLIYRNQTLWRRRISSKCYSS